MNLLWLIPVALIAAFLFRMLFLARPGIDLASAQAQLKSGAAVLVDIREPNEWTDGVAKQAVLLPYSELSGPGGKWPAFLSANQAKQLLLYCQSGTRSGMAAAQLRKQGYRAVNVGSLRDWDRAGWPVCKLRGQR
jgi:rhodanese-related sulfurtransferase